MCPSKVSWHVHFHHPNNTKLLVAGLCSLLHPISCQVLLDLPLKYLLDLSPQPFVWPSSLAKASQLVWLLQSCPHQIFSPQSSQNDLCQTLAGCATAFDTTCQLPLSEWTDAFLQAISTISPQYTTPNTPYPIQVCQHAKEIEKFNLSLKNSFA